MQTVITKQNVENTTKPVKKSALATMEFWQLMEKSRFGVIPIVLTVLGCISGIAAAFGAHGNTTELALIAFPTILSLALILAVAPMRLIIWLSSAAILLDVLVLIF